MSDMEKWIDIVDRLPQEGRIVRIKLGNLVKDSVLFKDGRFWRSRQVDGSGQAYEPDSWAPIEKKVKETHDG